MSSVLSASRLVDRSRQGVERDTASCFGLDDNAERIDAKRIGERQIIGRSPAVAGRSSGREKS